MRRGRRSTPVGRLGRRRGIGTDDQADDDPDTKGRKDECDDAHSDVSATPHGNDHGVLIRHEGNGSSDVAARTNDVLSVTDGGAGGNRGEIPSRESHKVTEQPQGPEDVSSRHHP
jgi:hypothetical protein